MLNCLKFSNILKYSLATAGVLAWFPASAQVDEIVITAQKSARLARCGLVCISFFRRLFARK